MNYYSDVVGYTPSLIEEINNTEDKLADLKDEQELLKKLDSLGIDLDVLKRLLKKER